MKAEFSFSRAAVPLACPDISTSTESELPSLSPKHLHTVAIDSLFEMASKVLLPSCTPVLVIGCDETMYPAFRLAAAMELAGNQAFVQSTTRSPLMLGGDITSAMHVPDLRGLGVGYYLYNFHPEQYNAVVFVHDSPLDNKVKSFMNVLSGYVDCYEASLLTGKLYRARFCG